MLYEIGDVTVITRRSGASISDRVHFKATSRREIQIDEICELQINAGYHPCGYGGPWGLSIIHNELNREWVATWSCSASCD
jgi:hypothetical protein